VQEKQALAETVTKWLVEYNFNRPHQSLAYLAPMGYIEKELAKIHSPVLPMWSASTFS
jgi:transposase InsO family protein